jgi:hypothetical protein
MTHHVFIQINKYKSSYMKYYSFKELFLYVDSIEMINCPKVNIVNILKLWIPPILKTFQFQAYKSHNLVAIMIFFQNYSFIHDQLIKNMFWMCGVIYDTLCFEFAYEYITYCNYVLNMQAQFVIRNLNIFLHDIIFKIKNPFQLYFDIWNLGHQLKNFNF